MKLKGTMVLELTDEATGEVESVTEENMVTEAVNDILGMNPMGVFYSEEDLADVLSWNGTLLPICPNMVGGILLFPDALEENTAHIYEMSGNLPVAYASNNVNTTANTARGSLNQTESKALENGYKFVWEFTPSQGNGTIAAVALTSAQGGQNAYGSLVGDASAFLKIKKLDIGDLGKAKQMVLFEAAEMDFENDLLYSITFADSSVRIRKVRIPIFTIGLNEKLDDSTYTVLEDHAVTTETFLFLGSYTKYGEFLDGKDGYWYGFSNQGNSSGNAKMLWVKVSKADYSMTEGEWTLSNAKLMAVGERDTDSSYPERSCRCCILAILKGILGMAGGVSSGPAGAEIWYRVRKSWADVSSQKGAFKSLENAKKCADENPGHSVFNESGKAVYTKAAAFRPYLVRVSIPDLNIRRGPGTDRPKTGKVTGVGIFTIVDEADGEGASRWGLLKSYREKKNGWISLDYASRV